MAFNTNIPNKNTLMFLDPIGPVGVARYDLVKYPIFRKLTKKLRQFAWQPEEVSCEKDGPDFRKLTEHEQHIFTSNLFRQIVLDSKQGSAPTEVLAPIASLADVRTYITKWAESEDIHSESYTHIIQKVYPVASDIFDKVLTIEPVMQCAESISKHYDELETWNDIQKNPRLNGGYYTPYRHKKALWMCINAINALEGVRFYVSFACSWAFAELKKMEGNAKIIKLIARDENIHLAGTQQILKLLPQEDPDFAKIREECKQDVIDLFVDVVNQEIEWAEYLFKDGSMIGLNAELLTDYVKWIAHKRMLAIGVDSPYDGGSNPLPWTQKWISGDDVQVAPQETEITSYIIGSKRNANPKSARYEKFSL